MSDLLTCYFNNYSEIEISYDIVYVYKFNYIFSLFYSTSYLLFSSLTQMSKD